MICHSLVNSSYSMHLILYHTGHTTSTTSLNSKVVGSTLTFWWYLLWVWYLSKRSCMSLIPFISSIFNARFLCSWLFFILFISFICSLLMSHDAEACPNNLIVITTEVVSSLPKLKISILDNYFVQSILKLEACTAQSGKCCVVHQFGCSLSGNFSWSISSMLFTSEISYVLVS